MSGQQSQNWRPGLISKALLLASWGPDCLWPLRQLSISGLMRGSTYLESQGVHSFSVAGSHSDLNIVPGVVSPPVEMTQSVLTSS